ncbi:plasmid replication initiator TrfA [Polaromonas sp.]|uniref:plasmid replication initiator TrfA n=1 Tax=Polaromonas sp. TaxID=1869339 RepID=UPI003BB61938
MQHISDLFPADPQTAANGQAQGGLGARSVREIKPLSPKSAEFLRQKTQAALQTLGQPEPPAAPANPVQPVLQLAFSKWDEDRRGVPNPLIRGGLFSTRTSKARLSFKSAKIASLSNADILYTGEELRQDDLSVWLAIVHLGRNRVLGEPIYFTAYAIIKDMNWRMHSDSYARLRNSIDRLKVTSIKITLRNERSGYAGSLIRDFLFDGLDEAGKSSFVVRLEPPIASLFLHENTTLVEWAQRRQIGSKAALTLWLHMFYSSHREPIPYSVSKLREQCLSEEKDLSNFRARLRKSLETLISVGLLVSYAILDDMVHVKRAVLNRRLQLA